MRQALCCPASPSRSRVRRCSNRAWRSPVKPAPTSSPDCRSGCTRSSSNSRASRRSVREGLQLQSGFNAQVNGELTVGGLQENVVVTGVSPIVDVRSTTQGTRFNVEELQAIPSARDVFQVLTQTPGIAGDRQNVGGTHNGQQTGMFSRGAGSGQGRWFVDGVDRNDLANGRPFVIDFNSVEEVQVSTGGADVTMQTPGVFVNVVTKSGSDAFHGASWFLRTDRHLGSTNVTDEQRAQGANSGNPLVYTNDYGGQLGGPIKKGRAWFWGTYGMQNVRLGVLNVYQQTPECAPVQANPLALSVLGRHRLPDAEQAGRAGARVEVQRPPVQREPLHGRQFVRSARRDHPQRGRPPSDVRDDEQDGVHGQERQHVRPWRRVVEHRNLGSELEVRRSAHVQRPLAGRRVLRPSLLVQLDRSADAGASAAAADAGTDHRHLGTVVVGFDDHARHQQHPRRQQQLLPAGQVGWRSLVQGRLQVRSLRRGLRPHLQRARAGGVQQCTAAADLQHAVHRARDPRLHHAGLLRPALALPAGHVSRASG